MPQPQLLAWLDRHITDRGQRLRKKIMSRLPSDQCFAGFVGSGSQCAMAFAFVSRSTRGVNVCGVNRDVGELVAQGVDVHSVSEKIVALKRWIVCGLFFRR